MILIVGQNLAKASPGEVPFEGTRSGSILKGWLDAAGITEYELVNVLNHRTQGNRPLTGRELRSAALSLGFCSRVASAKVVVTLGRQAAQAVKMAIRRIESRLPEIVELEHPSGRNRNLNDPVVRAAQVEALTRARTLYRAP